MNRPQQFSVYLRLPGWTNTNYQISINGKNEKINIKPGNYIVIKRKWKDGDRIEYLLPMPFSTINIPGNKKVKALCYGPIVLSANLSEGEPAILVSNGQIEKEIILESTHPLRFKIPKADGQSFYKLVPYYENMGVMAVYFDTFNSEEWQATKKTYLLKINKAQYLAQHTLDQISLGEMQPERDHQFDSYKCTLGERLNRKIRETEVNGWMEFTMNVVPNQKNIISTLFYGNNGSRTYDIYVDGKFMTTDIIHWMGDQFVERSYEIPIDLIRDKNQVRIRFSAKGDGMVPPVTEVRIIN
jgi:hypothetical protein